MPRRRSFSDAAIAKLSSRPKPYTVPDPGLSGHYVRVRPTGAKVFVAVARAPNGKQVWHTIGASTLYNIEEAREKAREAIKAIKSGGSRDGVETFEAVAEQWLKRHVEAKGLISAPDIRSYLARYLVPSWAGREFSSIRRGDVAKLLELGGGLKRTYRRRLCAVCDTRALQLVRSSARKLFFAHCAGHEAHRPKGSCTGAHSR